MAYIIIARIVMTYTVMACIAMTSVLVGRRRVQLADTKTSVTGLATHPWANKALPV